MSLVSFLSCSNIVHFWERPHSIFPISISSQVKRGSNIPLCLLFFFQGEQIQSLSLFYPALHLLDHLGGHPPRAFYSILLMSCTGGKKGDMVILDGAPQRLPVRGAGEAAALQPHDSSVIQICIAMGSYCYTSNASWRYWRRVWNPKATWKSKIDMGKKITPKGWHRTKRGVTAGCWITTWKTHYSSYLCKYNKSV